MIHAIYHRQHHALTIDGHAHSGEPGQDLVCASVSALAYTLAANVENLKSQGAVRNAGITLDPGKTEIRCSPVTRFRSTVTLIYDTVCAGLDILSQQYPENIRYEIHD